MSERSRRLRNSISHAMVRLWGMVAVGLLSLAAARAAHAQDLTAAANAYSKAQQAELAGRPAAAAELYELADSLAPTPEALRSALRTRRAAGQLATAALHAEALLERYPDDERSTKLARETLEAAKESLARYEITCAPESCGLIVDGGAAGAAVSKQHVIFLDPGEHQMNASFGTGAAEPVEVTVRAGEPGSLSFEAPPAPEPEVSEEPPAKGAIEANSPGPTGMDRGATAEGGLSPWYFAAGAVATAGLGAATIWSGLDVLSAHEDYQKNQTQSGFEDGRDRERRTNILIGATAGAGAATLVLAIFTDWGGSSEPSEADRKDGRFSASVNPLLSGGTLTIQGTY